jgi:hypothetical protein
MEKEYKQVQLGVDSILGTKTLIRRKRKSVLDKKRELFFNVIVMMEELFVRQNLVYADLNLDFSNYDEKFFTIIDMLLYMNFGKQCMELIAFYLYDRVNADGTINALLINDDEELFLNNPTDLWNLMCKVNPKIDEQNI